MGVLVGPEVGVTEGEVSGVGVGVSCANTVRFGVEVTFNRKPTVAKSVNVDFLILTID